MKDLKTICWLLCAAASAAFLTAPVSAAPKERQLELGPLLVVDAVGKVVGRVRGHKSVQLTVGTVSAAAGLTEMLDASKMHFVSVFILFTEPNCTGSAFTDSSVFTPEPIFGSPLVNIVTDSTGKQWAYSFSGPMVSQLARSVLVSPNSVGRVAECQNIAEGSLERGAPMSAPPVPLAETYVLPFTVK